MRKDYSNYEDSMIRNNAQIMSAAEIGKLIGRSGMSVIIRARKIGADLNKHKDYGPKEDETIKRYAKEKTAAEIGKLLGRSSGSVGTRARKIGVSLMKHGERHHLARHSNDDVRLVRVLIDDGELTYQEISEKMEMSINTIKLIAYEKTRTQDPI